MIFVAAVIAYFAASPLVVAGRVVCHPTRCENYAQLLIPQPGVTAQQVEFRSHSGRRLYGVHLHRDWARFTVLLHHSQNGNALSNVELVRMLLNAGASVFVYDYEGYGMSEGSASVENMLADSEAAYDCLLSELRVEPSKVIDCGVELGCAAAVRVAERDPVLRGLNLDAPLSFPELAKRDAKWFALYPDALFPKYSVEYPGSLSIPVLVLRPGGMITNPVRMAITKFIEK